MAKFRAVVDSATYYPTLGVLVENGDVVDLPSDTTATGLVLVEPAAKAKKNVELEQNPEAVVESDTTAKEV